MSGAPRNLSMTRPRSTSTVTLATISAVVLARTIEAGSSQSSYRSSRVVSEIMLKATRK